MEPRRFPGVLTSCPLMRDHSSMAEGYKSEYHGLDSVAIRTDQVEIHAPANATFNDPEGKPRLVNCPNCDASYSIGYPMLYGPSASFENLADQLTKILRIDH